MPTWAVSPCRLPYLCRSLLSAIPLELYSSNIHLTFYCDDILGTVPLLRQFATLAVSQTLVRH